MINFIVCDNNKHILKNVVTTIDNIMMKNNIGYKIFSFSEYNNQFKSKVDAKKANTIYILDIHVNQVSGIDMARKIRENDQQAIIIFLSRYHQLAEMIITQDIMPLTFISKYKNYQERLKTVIDNALSILNIRKQLKIKEKGIHYQIPLRDILYITHDSVERKSIVITDYSEFHIGRTIVNFILVEHYLKFLIN